MGGAAVSRAVCAEPARRARLAADGGDRDPGPYLPRHRSRSVPGRAAGAHGVRAMRIAVFGAGAVGAFFGGLLVRGGADVHFIARGAQLDALRAKGILIRSLRLGDVHIPTVHAELDASRIGPCDLVLVCVKAHQTPQILGDVGSLVHAGTTLVTLQNGVESDEPLASRFGPRCVIPGVVYVGATIDEPGVVSHVAAGTIAIGARAEGDPSRLPAVAEA